MAFRSKNLYNATLYAVRQYFFKTEKYLNYYTLQPQFQKDNQPDYYALPTKVAQQTMRLVNQNFKSFFEALKSYKKTHLNSQVCLKFQSILIKSMPDMF